MSTFESLTYAQGRLALARAACDHPEIGKWQEHVKYWQDKLKVEEDDRAAEHHVHPTVLTHCPNDGNLLLMGFCDQCKSQYPHSG